MAKKKSRNKKNQPVLENEITFYIYSLIVITLSVIGILELGIVGELLTKIVKYLVGNMYGIFYVLVIILTAILMKDKTLKQMKSKYVIGCSLLFSAWLILCATPIDANINGMHVLDHYLGHSAQIMEGKMSSGGGVVGALFYSLSSLMFDRVGTFIVVAFLIVLAFILMVSKERRMKMKQGIIALGNDIKTFAVREKNLKKIEKYLMNRNLRN